MDSKKRKSPLDEKQRRNLEKMAGEIGALEENKKQRLAESNRKYRILQAESRAGAARIRFWILVLASPFILLWMYMQWSTSTEWERTKRKNYILDRIFETITGRH